MIVDKQSIGFAFELYSLQDIPCLPSEIWKCLLCKKQKKALEGYLWSNKTIVYHLKLCNINNFSEKNCYNFLFFYVDINIYK